MNEEQRKEQAQISPEQNVERIRNTSSDEMIAKYFHTSYSPQTPDIKKARKEKEKKFNLNMTSQFRKICKQLDRVKSS